MDIASIIKAVLTSGEERPGRPITDLQPGDRLIGRVIKAESDGRVLMDLGGRQALARIGFSVQSGQTLPLQVVENGSVLHLKVEQAPEDGKTGAQLPIADFHEVLNPSEREKLTGLMQRLMARFTATSTKNTLPEVIKNALVQVNRLFEPAPVDAPVRELSLWIKGAVEDRGMLLEKKIGDMVTASRVIPEAIRDTTATGGRPVPENVGDNTVTGKRTTPEAVREDMAADRVPRTVVTRDAKSQLLILRQFLQPGGGQTVLLDHLDGKSAAFMRHAVDQLLGHIETQQEFAIPRSADGELPQVFVHTMQLPDQKHPLRLKVYYPKKAGRSKGKRPHRIALLLDMDRLGPLRVDLSMQERLLQISFYASGQKAMDLIRTDVESVSEALTGYFDQVAIDCFVSREKIAAFEKEDAAGAGSGRIDLSV